MLTNEQLVDSLIVDCNNAVKELHVSILQTHVTTCPIGELRAAIQDQSLAVERRQRLIIHTDKTESVPVNLAIGRYCGFGIFADKVPADFVDTSV